MAENGPAQGPDADVVRLTRDGGVAVLEIDRPPVNAFGQALRGGLEALLTIALADPGIHAVVIASEGRHFSGGADIREFGLPADPAVPSMSAICDRVELAGKPVIAAIQGSALGAGLELALACHLRIAGPQARFGLPEVGLGLCPGAGGTQRLPRLIGAQAALRLMLTGRAIGPAEAQSLGLIDGVVDAGLREAAVTLAAEIAAEVAAGRRTLARTRDRMDGMRDAAAYQSAVAASRAAHAKDRLPAAGRIVDCVEAAQLLPFDQGIAFERAAFDDLRASPESAGLRHAFLAERHIADFPEAGSVPRLVQTVGVVGLGRTGARIALQMAASGYRVITAERDAEALVAGLERVSDLQEQAVAAGRLTSEARDREWERLTPAIDLAALSQCDLVIEAVPDDLGSKSEVMAALAAALNPRAVFATSATFLTGDHLGRLTGRPADTLILRQPAVADRARLAEIGVGPETAADAVATVVAVAKKSGKLAVRVAAAPGLVGPRMQAALRTAADFLIEDGATPLQVDMALRAWGFAMGPYQASDAAGLDKDWAERQRAAPGRDPAARYVELADLLVESGRLGQETGRGYYIYDQGPGGREDPEVLALLAELRAAKGIVARPIGSDEIRDRCLAALANEGARILGEAVVPRASDIDVVMVAGQGFPRWQGGPMFRAEARGLLVLRAELRRFADQAPEFWAVAPLIDQLIRDGRKLSDLGA
ncbi:enoyl-CoA hydratase-related protein [Tabrizicola sp. J26]|uniref:enoyl-CoA hydratase-related protein n=1 Tax=Alitabrizicola rongguiensis TaxID=2909234 RepID=UPI001F2976CA|nr:enoyl-CoA hydratase-related protein [Tabrizicola rongguiensis]MCF1709525.1 enoyl-CoA hydratase-related protein [Tabrizicola rongguiensis]